jgi:hypothetical protein
MMFRKLLSVAVLAAMFSLILGNTDAQARHCRSHHHRHRCCQTVNSRCGYGYGNNGNFNTMYANNGYQQGAGCGCR